MSGCGLGYGQKYRSTFFPGDNPALLENYILIGT